jgi:4-diphosphocytidyl-2-C-methyl-D-erythritol kinase
LKLFSPAKINLFLKVLSKRPDGYHELETLFERIRLGDDLILKKRRSDIRFRTSGYPVPRGPKNLALRAATLLRHECGVRAGADIFLKKRIPVSAGLGGGSSNAASTLLGLNRLWKLGLSKRRLLTIGSKLGSDVPFFIMEESYAFARGRGEILEPLKTQPGTLWHCLVKPPFGISTKQAYQGLFRRRRPPAGRAGTRFCRAGQRLTPKKVNVKMLVRSLQRGDSKSLSKLLMNSLELTLNKRVKTILDIKKKLISEGAFASLMSGSGSAVFGLFRSEKEAKRAARRLREKHKRWQVFVTSTY